MFILIFYFSGILLDINYKNMYEKNKESVLIDAPLFRLSWIGDGATIKQMPLVNAGNVWKGSTSCCVDF